MGSLDKRIRTLNFLKWELSEIDEICPNRSLFIRIAIREQLEEEKKLDILIPGGMKITTVNIEIELDREIDRLSKKGVFVSVSEFARRAVRSKILRERKQGIIKAYRDSLPKDMCYIPSYNGGMPFKIRRLE